MDSPNSCITRVIPYFCTTGIFEVTRGVFERLVLFHVSLSPTDMSSICNDINTSGERTHVALRPGKASLVSLRVFDVFTSQSTFKYLHESAV